MNWRIIKFKTGIKYLFDSIAGDKINFDKVNLERQIKVIQQNNYSFERKEDYYLVENDKFKVRLRTNSSDLSVFEEIFISGEYKKLLEVLLINKIEITSIVDLGSNIGLTSYLLSEYYRDALFICVEPDSGNYKLLEENTREIINKVLYENAIWGHETVLDLNHNFRDGLDWSIQVVESTDNFEKKVAAITLPMIISKNQLSEIGLLKIDIEGSEFELFKTIESSSFLDKVKVIVVEIHDEVGDRMMIIEKLIHYNFFIFPDNEVVIGINKKYISVY